jgi:hypothetical protein
MLTIRDPQARALAKKIADVRHISMTRAVIDALRAEISRMKPDFQHDPDLKADVKLIVREIQTLPKLDERSLWDIERDLYDENGLPK